MKPRIGTRRIDLPEIASAPSKLRDLRDGCGPLIIWWTLRYFGRRIGATRIIRDCHFLAKEGVFAICMAVCLRRYGFNVRFFSDKDPRPKPHEKLCYRRAATIGVEFCHVVSIEKVLEQRGDNTVLIMLYFSVDRTAHFSPVTGASKDYLELAFNGPKRIRKRDFLKRWHNRDILRQCIIVSP